MSAKAWVKNSRTKAMLEVCCGDLKPNLEKNKENQPPLHQVLSDNKPKAETPLQKNLSTEEFVNCIYAREYSMTSNIFHNFNETQTSLDLGIDFSALISYNMVNEIDLTCNEDMLPLSPTHLSPKTLSLECENCNLVPSPTPPNNESLPTEDFDSDDSVKDKDYCPSDDGTSSEDEIVHLCAKKSKQITSQTIRLSNDTENISSNFEPNQENHSIQVEAGPSSSVLSFSVNNCDTEIIVSARERKAKQKQQKILSYNVKVGCGEKCLKKCSAKFTPHEREEINKNYWALSWTERRIFMQNNTAVAIPKRKVTSEPKRAPRSTFTLKKMNGTSETVCKVFFLTTLGFSKSNDTVLYNSLNQPLVDKRGLHTKTVAFDRKLLTDHVETFHPLEPHYRREHAPLRRYISCDVTIKLMHKDFCEKYPFQKVSYELYRKHVNSMNISFAKLGNEACEVCEAYELHSKATFHDVKNAIPENCESCITYGHHREKYKIARSLYENHKKETQTLKNIYYSVDLQKVIMLPRLDSFKTIIFCPRLTAFNLTFAPVGKITNHHKPLACIWHDEISGRKQEDIMSCFYHFFLQNRDVAHIHLWMDNCSAQNKNWLLFSLLIFLVNSDLIATEIITFHYFEPGHTLMSCDQFHHQVELSMKRKGKLYDFQDFAECVASANLSRVDIKSLQPTDFFNFQNLVSDRRIQQSSPRVYLKDIIEVTFQRETYNLLYKNEINDTDYKVLRFMTDKYLKNTNILKPEFKSSPKGIEKARKESIINVLKDISVPHKMQFWQNLTEYTDNTETVKGNIRSTL